ncbi:hypothetical protein LCGC14_0043060 [marine sediment metagenome]|uniref:DUF922 domain-containing protein n=2 Tax=root TaxID=1 RepID=A0A7V1BI46_9RHOB|nr:hypothetical protein [Sulfitobacter litoralis]HDZ53368.1 hypothetical protein [Sulfitobacter litoralis]
MSVGNVMSAAARALCIATTGTLSGGQASAGVLDSFIDQSALYMTANKQPVQTCLKSPHIKTDISLLSPQITKQKPQNPNGHHPATGELQGLAHMLYGFELSFSLERISSSEGYCVRIAQITVHSGQQTPEIWILPRLSEGSCMYNTTYEHEMQHVQNYHDHLARFEKAILEELPIILKGQAYYQISSIGESKRAEKMLQDEALAAVAKLHDRSYEKSSLKDQIMDSPSEYRRLSQVCATR